MPQPPYEPNDYDRGRVETMAAFGATQDHIARKLGISKPTLRKYYRQTLDSAYEDINLDVMSTLYTMATGKRGGKRVQDPIPSATIFWAKSRCGLSTTQRHEHSGPNGNPIQTESSHKFDFSGKTLEQKKALLKSIRECVKDDAE